MTAKPETKDETDAEEDPIVEECIRDALGPFLDVLSPEVLADHRRFLAAFITTHPVAAPLYDRLRKRATRVRSGEMARGESEDEGAKAVQDDGTFGRPR